MNRIDRLTAILIHLQTKRVVKAEEIADRFEISLRTVYRDIRALMEAGVPVGSEAGKGYFIVEGYHLPPVMLSQEEASAILVAGKLVEKMTDRSIRKAFESSLLKIKSVLNQSEKDHLESLQSYIEVKLTPAAYDLPFSDQFLNALQQAAVNREILEIEYFANYNEQLSRRAVEPIGLFYYGTSWHLIAWCQLRKDYRDFRADRIKSLTNTGRICGNHNLLSLKEYIAMVTKKNSDVQEVVAVFERSTAKYLKNQRHNYGFVVEEDLGERTRMTFLTCHMRGLAQWFVGMGKAVEIESPSSMKEAVVELIEELNKHWMGIEAAR